MLWRYSSKNGEFHSLQNPLSRGVWGSRPWDPTPRAPAHSGKHHPHLPESCYITFQKHVWRNSGGYTYPPPANLSPLLSSPLYKPPTTLCCTQAFLTQVQWILQSLVLLWDSFFSQGLTCLCIFWTKVRFLSLILLLNINSVWTEHWWKSYCKSVAALSGRTWKAVWVCSSARQVWLHGRWLQV